jgi:P27 family predicted phage terminase small subunit
MPRRAEGGGTRGPLPTPSHLKLAPGSTEAEAAPINVAENTPVGAPERPDGMTAAEVKVWDQLVEALDQAGLIARCDGLTVELAVRHYVAAVAAHKRLKRTGPVIHDDKNKRDAKSPASQVFRDHSAAYLEYARMLGLGLAARARIPLAEGGDGGGTGNPFAQGRTG